MPYNVAIDIGNSAIKIALFEKGKFVSVARYSQISEEIVTNCLAPFAEKLGSAIIAATAPIPTFLHTILDYYDCKTIVLNHTTPLPFSVDYLTPTTLGNDRIAGVAGGCCIEKENNILIIDAGTAITFDYLLNGQFRGGNISPGLVMRFNALHHFTANLPICSPTEKPISPGRSTSQAIESGVIFGIVYEINSYIRTFFDTYPNGKVLFTGGDSSFFLNKLNHKVKYEPNLVLIGLNYILEYNVQQTL